MAQIFRHVPLDYSRNEIRFLRLLPADYDDEVNTELFAASIERDIPDFKAISYVWDLKGPRKSITVNDDQFEISETVYILLKNLQCWSDATSGMNIWIDSICINQEDTSEKTAQIPLMKDIYTKASRVLVWLGDGDECTDQAIAKIKSVDTWPRSLKKTHTQDDINSLATFFASVLRGVNDVFGREWFRRTWILQEVVLSPVVPLVLCGKSSLCWQCLTDLHSRLITSLFSFNYCKQPLEQLRSSTAELRIFNRVIRTHCPGTINLIRNRHQEFGHDEEGLSYLIRQTTHRLCTDPRDKIYGLLGMVSDIERQCLRVDYTKPLKDVFVDAFCYLINRKYGFQVLSTAGVTGLTKHRGWPTWLPRFEVVSLVGSDEPFRENFSCWSIYKASLGLLVQYSLVDAGDLKLLLNGIPIDEVIEARDASMYDGASKIYTEATVKVFLSVNRPCTSCLMCQKGTPRQCECPMYSPEISQSSGSSEEGKQPRESDSNGFILSIEEHCRRIENWKSQARKPLTEATWRAIIGDCLKNL